MNPPATPIPEDPSEAAGGASTPVLLSDRDLLDCIESLVLRQPRADTTAVRLIELRCRLEAELVGRRIGWHMETWRKS